jgi:putative salt-induced outer membrane protein YdiY
MLLNSSIVRLLPCFFVLPLCLLGQTTSSGLDAITFVNGDRISGQIIGATSRGLIFRGTMVGELTVEWSSIQDVHSENGFGAITAALGGAPAGLPLPRNTPPPAVNAGVQIPTPVAPAPVTPAPVTPPPAQAQVARAEPPPPPAAAPPVPAPTPSPAGEPAPSFATGGRTWLGFRLFTGWHGGATAGVAYVAATTSLLSFTPSVNLMRTWPKAKGTWPVRARTYINLMANYSKETQNGDVSYFDPSRRTIFIPGSFDETYTLHGEVTQDYFLFSRLFVQAGATFDHNYAQSLDLLQSYGGGLGYVLYRTDRSELDIRAGAGYSKQEYDGYPGFDTSVIGSRFYQSYEHKFANGMSFSEQGGMRPAWTDPKYLFGGGNLSFNVPVFHHLNLNVSSFDFWSNRPPPNLKKNIFQVSLGVNYAF